MEYVGNIIYDAFLMKNNTELVIFGAGRSGRKVYEFLERNNKAQNVKYFCDRNENLWGKRVEDIEVINPMQVVISKAEYHFLVSGDYADDMTEYLLQNGVKRIHLLFI